MLTICQCCGSTKPGFVGVFLQYAAQLLVPLPQLIHSSRDLQYWGFNPPGRSGKRHDVGRSCWSERRDCKISCLVESPIAKQSRERLSSLVLEYQVETAFCSLSPSLVTLLRWSCAGQDHACRLTGLRTELGPTWKEQECHRVPVQGNTHRRLLPALLNS